MSEPNRIFLERVKLAREYAGLSQEQVSKMLGISRPAVSDIESGKRKVDTNELVLMCEIFNVNSSWLLGEKEDQKDSKLSLAARELSKLQQKDIDKILNLIKSLK
ncbi:XRE family transcriptional regulator [Leptospira bourretii]|uniref:helix-turn-helix domain-containing protein n=1 Tax=Leptospira bourretii TaxID=2484962 RepID=UPI0010911F25|nr:helix-turn-helix transcriptional regulator [Leptospira bourretii]TGL18567.1 XRE family transcriptional regulator [Leptospira bourretii]